MTDAEKFGLAELDFLGLERSGRLTGLVLVGVFEKNDAIDFCAELELDFFRVAGVEAAGVEDFFAIVIQSTLITTTIYFAASSDSLYTRLSRPCDSREINFK